MDARDPILILGEQLLELRSERRLIVGVPSGLQGSADPSFGGCLVIVVLGLIASPVRRRLIEPRGLATAFQPIADQFSIPCFRGSLFPLSIPTATCLEQIPFSTHRSRRPRSSWRTLLA